jgi:hypothetical protein
MYLLTISSFLRTVVIIIIIAYGVKFLMRYVFPNMVQNYVDKKMNDLKKDQAVSEAEAQRIKKEQGKVKISQNPAKDGEYTDYEEVK